MVGEQAQEMQMAHWLPRAEIPDLANLIPPWMEVWFSVFRSVASAAAAVASNERLAINWSRSSGGRYVSEDRGDSRIFALRV